MAELDAESAKASPRRLRVGLPRLLVAMLVIGDSLGGLLILLPARPGRQGQSLAPRASCVADLLDGEIGGLGRFFS